MVIYLLVASSEFVIRGVDDSVASPDHCSRGCTKFLAGGISNIERTASVSRVEPG